MANLTVTITCPICDHAAAETMPTDRCVFFYECRDCGEALKAKPGDCCVYCSYGDMPCPSVQDKAPLNGGLPALTIGPGIGTGL